MGSFLRFGNCVQIFDEKLTNNYQEGWLCVINFLALLMAKKLFASLAFLIYVYNFLKFLGSEVLEMNIVAFF